MPIFTGPGAGLKWITGTSPHGCWLGVYERRIQAAFVRYARKGGVVYDIGANVGFFTLLAARLVGIEGRVYSFEPLPRNLRRLESHVQMNQLSNVRIIETAVSDGAGEVCFRDEGCGSMAGISKNGGIRIRTTSLDLLIEEETIDPPDLMKIDVEGAEDLVLRGAGKILKTFGPTIILSSHGSAKRRRCAEILAEYGYSLNSLRDGASDGNYEDIALPD